MEATQVSIDQWMDYWNAVYTAPVLLFGLKNEGDSAICYNMDELESIVLIMWNKPVTKTK